MKTNHCVACFETENLQHHHLIPRSHGGGEDERNLITLCEGCHAKAHGRPVVSHRELTVDGLVKAKARGVKLGSPDPRKGNRAGIAVLKQKADAFAEQMRQHVDPVRDLPLRGIAKHLQSLGIKARSGGDVWSAGQVGNLMRRLYP